VVSGLISYPIDTIRRRMMMTSGEKVKYKGSIDCTVQILKNEGFMSFMKGAGQYIVKVIYCLVFLIAYLIHRQLCCV
jgi:solute carrier family 25 (mitochondrial adenine nucleotide translocator), member 4/5/6/31